MDQLTYVGMSEPVRKTYTVLNDERVAAHEIDRVVQAGVQSRLPVFIYVPVDMVSVPLPAKRLSEPLQIHAQSLDSVAEDQVVGEVLESIRASNRPAILVDVLTIRHGAQPLARSLVSATHIPSYSTPMSKGVIDETSPSYCGVYNGQGTLKQRSSCKFFVKSS